MRSSSNLDWVYRNLEHYGNTIVSVEHYRHLSMRKLGKHTKRLLPNNGYKHEKDCYIIERVYDTGH